MFFNLLNVLEERSIFAELDFLMQVHIPCNSDKQLVLITANFIDGFFDVLNPDSCNEKFENIINTVVYNFKILFLNDYPRCPYFDIKGFKVRYVDVPKHNFRLAILPFSCFCNNSNSGTFF